MDLAGRHVVVTGAAGGIGRALATRFHAAGANVVAADLDETGALATADALNAQRPGSAAGIGADIGTEYGNVELIRAAEDRFGQIDLFFANAGVGMGSDPMNTDEATWETIFNINTHAHRWAAKHLLPGWLAREEGYFCSTASAAGLLTQIGSAPYSLTKHAAVAFAEWLSVTYGDRGIRVSCLCPQGVNTNLLNSGGADRSVNNAGANAVRSSGKVLEPEEVAEVVLAAI